ncbi:hypothetical protein DOM21_16525 [Bacteriovorax stolpii]|nr:hypothetical protein DOM21_16525 [Bacteriovorax stolpii]
MRIAPPPPPPELPNHVAEPDAKPAPPAAPPEPPVKLVSKELSGPYVVPLAPAGIVTLLSLSFPAEG